MFTQNPIGGYMIHYPEYTYFLYHQGTLIKEIKSFSLFNVGNCLFNVGNCIFVDHVGYQINEINKNYYCTDTIGYNVYLREINKEQPKHSIDYIISFDGMQQRYNSPVKLDINDSIKLGDVTYLIVGVDYLYDEFNSQTTLTLKKLYTKQTTVPTYIMPKDKMDEIIKDLERANKEIFTQNLEVMRIINILKGEQL